MLISILVWSYIFIVCLIFGSYSLNLISKFIPNQTNQIQIPLVAMAGLVVITSLASFFSLFIKIGGGFQIILLSICTVIIAFKQIKLPVVKWDKNIFIIAILLPALLIVLENATHSPNNPDTNIYHAQAIRWIESYPAVFGLGNLHGRLAYNSAWFISNAIFSFAFLGKQSFHLVPSFTFIIFLWYAWEGVLSSLKLQFSIANITKLAFFTLSISLFGAEISSPGTDLPANIMVWFVICIWLDHIEHKHPIYSLLIVLLSLFSVTVKLSTLPILISATVIFWYDLKLKNKYALILYFLLGSMIILPYILRNIIQSGYLLYPFPSINIFSFDWKIPLERVKEESSAIMAWAKLPHQNPEWVNSLEFTQWFPEWLSRQTPNRILILGTSFMSFLFVLPGLAKKYPGKIAIVWATAFTGTIFWLNTAPDFRFGYGFIISSSLLAICPWVVLFIPKHFKLKRMITIGTTSVISIFLLITLAKSMEWNTLSTRLILPADYKKVATQPCNIDHLTIYCAKSYNACSYFDFPCIPNPRGHIIARGNTLAQGFRAIP